MHSPGAVRSSTVIKEVVPGKQHVAPGIYQKVRAGCATGLRIEPLMTTGALLAHSVGAIIGAGPGRGIGLMFICLGMSMALVALSAYCSTAIREIDEMQDESFSAVAVGSALNGESTVVAQF